MKQACLPIGHHAGQGGCAPGTPHDRLRLDVTPETNNRSAWPDCQVRDENRNREFDIDIALDRAVRVYCERGYHATSIGDLTAAMELATGSIYKAFRDKHAVFMAALDRYTALRQQQTRGAAAHGKNGWERVRNVLLSYIEHSQGSEGRRGCLVVGSAVELAAMDPVIAARVGAQLKTNETFIAGLIREGQADGSIPRHVEANDTARLMICLTQGLRVVGKARLPLDGERLIGVAMKLLA